MTATRPRSPRLTWCALPAMPATTAWACGSRPEITGTAVPPVVAAALQETGLVALDVEVIWLQPGGKPDPYITKSLPWAAKWRQNCLIVSSEPDREITKRLFEDLCVHAEARGHAGLP